MIEPVFVHVAVPQKLADPPDPAWVQVAAGLTKFVVPSVSKW
jgi:hypothetical protein